MSERILAEPIHRPTRRPHVQSAAFQGVAGAFGEQAVRRHWRGRVRPQAVPTFAAVFDALVAGEARWAVVPVWNSTIGPIAAACALVDQHADVAVPVGEVEVSVQHHLLGLPGTSIADVRYVGSHPAALAQCSRFFLQRPELVPCEAFDTAGAARELAAIGEPLSSPAAPWYHHLRVDSPRRLAAIASATAARRYGLVVLRRAVQDDPRNVTRFAVLALAEGSR
jgi:prephenate dehydratase